MMIDFLWKKRKTGALQMKPCHTSSPFSRDFVIKKQGKTFFNADIMSISYVIKKITKQQLSIFMKIQLIGTIVYSPKNKRVVENGSSWAPTPTFLI